MSSPSERSLLTFADCTRCEGRAEIRGDSTTGTVTEFCPCGATYAFWSPITTIRFDEDEKAGRP